MKDKDRSADAFERVVAPYERQVYFICLRVLGNPQDAQDCAQDAMLRAFRAFSTFRGDAAVSTWLYTIANRACTDFIRKKKVAVSYEAMVEAGWDAASDTPTPYQQLEENERKRLLVSALKQLPDEQRRAVVFVDIQGLDYSEAAQVLRCPVGTLKSRLSRARNNLRNILLHMTEQIPASTRPNNERREADEL